MVTRFHVGTNRPTQRLTLHVSSVSPLPKSYRDAFSDPNRQNAMRDEYHALIKNKTWILVSRPTDTNIVRCMWFFGHKYLADETLSRYKARLVANGSTQLEGVDMDETFSPSSRCDSLLFIYRQGTDIAYLLSYVDDIVLTASSETLLHQYLTFTRPDFSYVVQQVCLYMHDPREPHFSALKRILRYVRGTLDYGLQLFSSSTSELVAYSDADWAGCPTTRRSTFGYCVFHDNNLLSWSAKHQPTLSRFSAEAEYRGVVNAVAETCWLRNLLHELYTPLSSTTIVYCDNVSVVYLSSNPVQHQRTKHIEIDIHFVRDLVAAGQVQVLHGPSRYQFADIFTKGLPSTLFEELRTILSVRSPPASTSGESLILESHKQTTASVPEAPATNTKTSSDYGCNTHFIFESDTETDWVKLLKPFDIEKLKESLNKITPLQLYKLLKLPLNVSILVELFDWANTQKGYCHTFDVYYVLIDKLGSCQEFKVIDRLLLQMRDEGVVFRETLFVMIIRHYQKAGLPGQATRLLLEMRDAFKCGATCKVYNTVLDVLVDGGCAEVARNVFYEMVRIGVAPDVFSFAFVMKGLCSVNEVIRLVGDRVDEALKLLEQMILMGCMPDVETFNDVIHGLCRAKRIHEAAKLVDRMLVRGFTPNALTYGVLIHGLCRTKQVAEAKALLSKVPEPNSVMFNMLINGFVMKGQFDEAKAVLNDNMLRNGYEPDIHTYNTLIRGLCKNDRLFSARDLMKEMKLKGCEPDMISYTILIDGFCKKGRLEEASEVMREMTQKGLSLNTVGYNSIIHALCKVGNVSEALNMFHDMCVQGCKPDIFTFNSLIFGLCDIDEMESALKMFQDMVLEGVVADTVTYNTLIHAFLKKGAIPEAFKLVNEMLFRGCPLDEITYNGLIKALCRDGAVEKAWGLFEEMVERGLNPSTVSCNLLINGLCRFGKVQEAFGFLRDMVHLGMIPDIVTYNSLINGLCKIGNVQEAMNLFENLQSKGMSPNVITYNTLLFSYCKESMLDDAYLLLNRGVAKGFVPNDVTWYILVSSFVKEVDHL
ncbi:pentatricopeptide repeat-containing protein [Tanacetum coccineum]